MLTAENKRRLQIAAAVIACLLAWCFFAAAHIVHGGGMGWHLCWKKGWTLDDTFVDLDDLRNPSVKLGYALDKCLK
jgi:hypothetical protein